MGKQTINIVWLKRDLRSLDHEPLFNAEKSNVPYIIIYVFEPEIIEYPDTSLRHLTRPEIRLHNIIHYVQK